MQNKEKNIFEGKRGWCTILMIYALGGALTAML